MKKKSTIYVPVKVLAMNGNLRKELPTVESLVDENGRLTVTESDLAGRATLTYTKDREPYVILAEKSVKDALNHLKGLHGRGLRFPKEYFGPNFCYAESLENIRVSNLRKMLGY